MQKKYILFIVCACCLTISKSSSIIAEINPLTIQRSPSASSVMGFCDDVEQQVSVAEAQQPGQLFYINFDTLLVPLLGRLQNSNIFMQEIWHKNLARLFSSLAAHQHRIHGVKLVYRDLNDLPLIARVIDPLLQANRLHRCELMGIWQPNEQGLLPSRQG